MHEDGALKIAPRSAYLPLQSPEFNPSPDLRGHLTSFSACGAHAGLVWQSTIPAVLSSPFTFFPGVTGVSDVSSTMEHAWGIAAKASVSTDFKLASTYPGGPFVNSRARQVGEAPRFRTLSQRRSSWKKQNPKRRTNGRVRPSISVHPSGKSMQQADLHCAAVGSSPNPLPLGRNATESPLLVSLQQELYYLASKPYCLGYKIMRALLFGVYICD